MTAAMRPSCGALNGLDRPYAEGFGHGSREKPKDKGARTLNDASIGNRSINLAPAALHLLAFALAFPPSLSPLLNGLSSLEPPRDRPLVFRSVQCAPVPFDRLPSLLRRRQELRTRWRTRSPLSRRREAMIPPPVSNLPNVQASRGASTDIVILPAAILRPKKS